VKTVDQGLCSLLGERPHTLVLGSMPSQKSLQYQRYYGNPQNAFWWVMAELFAFEHASDYATKCQHLMKHGVAIWDVVAQCHRPGSLDAAIDQSTVIANDFAQLLSAHASISRIVFNGQAASKLFKKHVCLPILIKSRLTFCTAPSTSPAFAAMRREQKRESWRVAMNISDV
jgi:hypoxanthine-DNA glycosylase